MDADKSMNAGAAQRGVAYAPQHHWISELNFRPEVTEAFDFPQPLTLIDSTVRKTIYTAGVRPGVSDILRICAILSELGVKEESLNLWWWGEAGPNAAEYEAVRHVAAGGFGFRTTVFTDTLAGDGRAPAKRMRPTVDLLARLGVTSVNAGLMQPADAGAAARQGDDFVALSEYAGAAGLDWMLTIANCGRRDFDSMVQGVNLAIAAGVKRLDFMDSTSSLSPEAMKVFVRTLRSKLARPVPLTMHAHDDFGMSTALTVAAVTAGASPDVSLNGVSYRSGFAAMEEVVLALEVLYGLDTGIRLDLLQSASEQLASIMGFPVHPLKPVVGSHQFVRELPGDIALLTSAGADAFPSPGQCVAPAVTGGAMTWVFGKQSGVLAVRAIAKSLNRALDGETEAAICAELDARLNAITAYPKWISAEEATALVKAWPSHAAVTVGA